MNKHMQDQNLAGNLILKKRYGNIYTNLIYSFEFESAFPLILQKFKNWP